MASAASAASGDKQQYHYRHKADSRRNKPVQEFCPNNFALDRKVKEACKEVKPADERLLLELSDEDKELIADFIIEWSD
jgi:hypothetical protein